MSNKHLDVVKSTDGMNPVFVVKNEEVGRNVNFDEDPKEAGN